MQPVYKWEWGLLDATTHAYCTLLPCPGVTSGPDATAKGCRRDSRQLQKLLALRSRGGQGEGVSGQNRVALAVPLKDGNLTVLPSHRQEVPFRAPFEDREVSMAHLCSGNDEEGAHEGAVSLAHRELLSLRDYSLSRCSIGHGYAQASRYLLVLVVGSCQPLQLKTHQLPIA